MGANKRQVREVPRTGGQMAIRPQQVPTPIYPRVQHTYSTMAPPQRPLHPPPTTNRKTQHPIAANSEVGTMGPPPPKRIEVSYALTEAEKNRMKEVAEMNKDKSVQEVAQMLYQEFNKGNEKKPIPMTAIHHYLRLYHLPR